VVEASGIEIHPDGDKIWVSDRRGDIWLIENAFADDLSTAKWHLYARGLHESLGMGYKDGWLYLTQRPEVTRIKDTDGDHRADVFETVSDGWQVNGDYHEYAFGTRPDKKGIIWVVLCLTGSGSAKSNYRGWCVRVGTNGRFLPTCSGVRSPGGIGFNDVGDVFYTDNQGLWNGSSSLKWLKPGGFVGNPVGNKYYELTDAIGPRPENPQSGGRLETERKRVPELVPPSIVIPHGKLGNSPSGVEADMTGGKFGPFAGQTFVNEQTKSRIHRCYLEKVNGMYQGAVFAFRSGYGSGNVPLRFAKDGTLFVGGTNRGWGSTGRKPFAIERTRFLGKTPFEIHEMRLEKDGFTFTFTEPVDPESIKALDGYKLKTWTYKYQSGYGSPEVDHTDPKVTGVSVAADGLSLKLGIDGLTKGHVHEVKLEGVRSADDKPLLHNGAWYTINELK